METRANTGNSPEHPENDHNKNISDLSHTKTHWSQCKHLFTLKTTLTNTSDHTVNTPLHKKMSYISHDLNLPSVAFYNACMSYSQY